LTARELDGEKVILPVWHNVDEPYVRRFSPTLADRVAVSTQRGLDFVVKEILNAVRLSEPNRKLEETAKKPVRSRLESAIRSLRGRYLPEIATIARESDFDTVKQTFVDILNGIALFDLPQTIFDASLFDFIESAILERNETEGIELFGILLDWFFQTVTPNARVEILRRFAKLTRLSFPKKVILERGRSSSFVAEFGLSDNFEVAAINSEILMNIQNLLSDSDLEKFVNFALANNQILSSWAAKRYLVKILALCEAKVNNERTKELAELLL
jgi:hypothetical protein